MTSKATDGAKKETPEGIPTPFAIGASVFILGLSIGIAMATNTIYCVVIAFGINWAVFVG